MKIRKKSCCDNKPLEVSTEVLTPYPKKRNELERFFDLLPPSLDAEIRNFIVIDVL